MAGTGIMLDKMTDRMIPVEVTQVVTSIDQKSNQPVATGSTAVSATEGKPS